MRLADLAAYVTAVRALLNGETTVVDAAAVRLIHGDGLTALRPTAVPIWLSAFGPRGAALASGIADGLIGRPHPTLRTATLVSGTVLDPGEPADSPRVLEAIGPWRVVPWHDAYADGGAAAVDALPGGAQWRTALEALAAEDERHLLTFEGHVTHLTERDRGLLEHIDVRAFVGDAARIGRHLEKLSQAGFAEVIYTPSGPDVARELRAMAGAYGAAAAPFGTAASGASRPSPSPPAT
jgi:5,10-methylenetetrahydromethanopterin reductase